MLSQIPAPQGQQVCPEIREFRKAGEAKEEEED